MKTRLLIIIGIVIIAAIIVSAVGTTQYQTAYNQNCNSDGGKVVGFLKCIYINEDFGEKLGSDCRMMFGKGTPEMFDCLEKIESEPIPVLEGYGICLFENGKYKEVEESNLETHLAHGGEMVDCNTFRAPMTNTTTTDPISSDDAKSTEEHYEIEITGLKDFYIVGEIYDFSYIISGYGNSCGSKTITFPDSSGDTIGSASSASCIANLPMGMFVFDIQKEQGTTYGHIEITNPGTYSVTVTFDRPSQYFPTTVSKEFRVVEE